MSALPARILVVLLGIMFAASTALATGETSAPHDLQMTVSGSNVHLTWRAPDGTSPTGFTIEAGSGPGLTDLAIVNIPWDAANGQHAQFEAAGVAPGVYYVRIRARYDQIVGDASEELLVRVGTSPCPIPPAPQHVVATVDGGVVTLDWDGPTGQTPAGYVIEAGNAPGVPNIAFIQAPDTTSLSVNAPPGVYFVRLRTMGSCGTSEPTSEVVISVP